MKFLHTADWHIGKELGDYSLLEQQQTAFEQTLAIAQAHQVDAVLLAGDLYDRSIPPVDAVNALEPMLKRMNIEAGLPIFAVSGNHDGPTRLGAGKEWRENNQFYLRTTLAEAFEPIIFGDTQIFMLPFIDPLEARVYYGISNETNELRTINEVMARVITDMQANFDPTKQHVLVSHYYVAGKQNETYDLTSETNSKAGGLKSIDVNQFNAFDYVALGHLHLKQASPSETVQYSGSPIKFNTKEAQSEKGVFIVDVNADGVSSEWVPLQPEKDLILLEADFKTLTDPAFYQQYSRQGENLFSIKMTDRPAVTDLRNQLNDIYGEIVEIQFKQSQAQSISHTKKMTERAEQSNQDLIREFYETVTDATLTKHQAEIIDQTLTRLERKED
ncbi:exonuclease SbcCD subunit D [Weissella viridescens]|uniref:exonuclease SbcCD subunit D n=1 Tax=Weissella viridescens TaxID=1629 RepID=UPI001D095DD3|nr:exonuclease SbcCD subunit D [Weissella viridescens]MCB6839854.1 exonuclease SbcCD subunit D [Weissella viridescens]MCB6846586.1 exonuclease SbcCD subunit D [Weissella viridescens]WJI90700.1 exonuclease SbcCD subunit D [Weissella viridescens]